MFVASTWICSLTTRGTGSPGAPGQRHLTGLHVVAHRRSGRLRAASSRNRAEPMNVASRISPRPPFSDVSSVRDVTVRFTGGVPPVSVILHAFGERRGRQSLFRRRRSRRARSTSLSSPAAPSAAADRTPPGPGRSTTSASCRPAPCRFRCSRRAARFPRASFSAAIRSDAAAGDDRALEEVAVFVDTSG